MRLKENLLSGTYQIQNISGHSGNKSYTFSQKYVGI